MNSVLISAIHKSSGKTLVTLGLTQALMNNGKSVQTFKKGPDYIDPMWLSHSSAKKCRNLDFHFMTKKEIISEFVQFGSQQDLSIIEGNKGLYDGVDIKGADSNAALAKLLGTPVILVIDTRGMTRGIAPIIQGQKNFDHDINIAGVILNFVGGTRHEQKLRRAIEYYTDTLVIGTIGRRKELEISERHLGLIPSNEAKYPFQAIKKIGTIIGASVDLNSIGEIANQSLTPKGFCDILNEDLNSDLPVLIAVACDNAFGFYYPRDYEALERAGAKLVFFNTLDDSSLPIVDGLFIGGGFPETNALRLSQNSALRSNIRDALTKGMPAYAECGGLMYLSKSLTWENNTHEMVGVIPGNSIMNERPIGRGYTNLLETPDCPWPGNFEPGKVIPAHEFHYATLENLPANTVFAYDVIRGHGVTGKKDGIVIKNLIAGFTHRFSTPQHNWARRFVQFVRQHKLSDGRKT